MGFLGLAFGIVLIGIAKVVKDRFLMLTFYHESIKVTISDSFV